MIGRLARRPEVVAGVVSGALYLWLPAVLGLDYRLLAPKQPYQLMWLNLLGAHYRLQLETPKPLMVVLSGLFGSGVVFYVLICAMVGLAVAALVRLGRTITGSYWPGLTAAATVFAFRGGLMRWAFVGGTEPFHVALVLSALVALAGGRLRLATFIVFAACLLRPEAWPLAPIPLLWIYLARRRFNLLSLLPFSAPLIWVVFDQAMTGDWLYSLHLTSYYRVASGISTKIGGGFWTGMPAEIIDVTGAVPLLVGLIGLGVWVRRCARPHPVQQSSTEKRSDYPAWLLAAIVALALLLPIAASWVISLFGRVVQMGRFQYPSAVLLVLLSTSAPFLFFSGRAPRRFVLALGLSAAVALSTLSPQELARAVRIARRDKVRAAAYAPIADALKHLVESGNADVTVVSARRLDYFTMLLGQSYSWKLRSVRELTYGTDSIPAAARSGALAFYDGDEINEPSTDSVISRVLRVWPTKAVVQPVKLLPDGHGGLWTIQSVR
ncbi:hypothetical protein JXD38_06750 [candidate division WOR-3 bacterium]|nr:hypothetical protein [candidate division WOR-3 bacterium]